VTPEPSSGPGILESLRRHAVLIVITGLIAGAIAALLLSRRDPQYEATSQVVFGSPGPALNIIGAQAPPTSSADRDAATNVALVQSGGSRPPPHAGSTASPPGTCAAT
jgi:uncharacterized protein involved in exopolysaccharide biosynthesis